MIGKEGTIGLKIKLVLSVAQPLNSKMIMKTNQFCLTIVLFYCTVGAMEQKQKKKLKGFVSIIVKDLENLRTALVYKRKYTSPSSMLDSETFIVARRLLATSGATQRQMQDRGKK